MWTPLFHPEVIDTEKPDIVIHEVMERFIDDLLLDDPGEPRYVQWWKYGLIKLSQLK